MAKKQSKPAVPGADGEDPAWRETLRTLKGRFEAAADRHPDLFNVLAIASEGCRERLHGPPFVETEGLSGVDRLGVCPVRTGMTGIAMDVRYTSADRTTLPELVPAFFFESGFFGCGDDQDRTTAALGAYRNLARTAWAALPPEVRGSLVSEPYLDPVGGRDGEWQWTLALYALAWREPAPPGLEAKRSAYRTYERGGKRGYGSRELEFWLRSRSGTGREIDPRVLAEMVEDLNRTPFGGALTEPFELPPRDFVAFLEPDVFLASALGIDALLACSPTPASHAPSTARQTAPLQNEPKRKEKTKSARPKPRVPVERTCPTSFVGGARWFLMDVRTLRQAVDAGEIAAAQLSKRLWVFDLAEVISHNPNAKEEADPQSTK